jgi:hypothetical protein
MDDARKYSVARGWSIKGKAKVTAQFVKIDAGEDAEDISAILD